MKLGINIDHIATLRQARHEDEPDLLTAAHLAVNAGADGITIHLREDRRHIQDADAIAIIHALPRVNLEMAATDEMIEFACQYKPAFCCLVPEKREELTTEGGLDIARNEAVLKQAVSRLSNAGILVSIFIDPDHVQIRSAFNTGAPYIEIHTGAYANASGTAQEKELQKIQYATSFATKLGLKVNAGHGLKYHNVSPIVEISQIEELNIGHSIISRSIFVGLEQAVIEMKALCTP